MIEVISGGFLSTVQDVQVYGVPDSYWMEMDEGTGMPTTEPVCEITVQELTAAANSVQATYFIPTEAFVVVIVLYWLISICLELVLKWAARFGAKRGFEHG